MDSVPAQVGLEKNGIPRPAAINRKGSQPAEERARVEKSKGRSFAIWPKALVSLPRSGKRFSEYRLTTFYNKDRNRKEGKESAESNHLHLNRAAENSPKE